MQQLSCNPLPLKQSNRTAHFFPSPNNSNFEKLNTHIALKTGQQGEYHGES